jgi:hypothetical protein
MSQTLNYIPKRQFMELMNITRWTFTKWVNERNLPVVSIGHRVFVPMEEYHVWVKKYSKNIPQEELNRDIEWDNIFSK